MTKEELSKLGISTEDVLNRLVEKLYEHHVDSEENYAEDFQSRLSAAVKQRVDETLAAAIDQHILPKITEMVQGICLEETNKWGEKYGTKLTFIEYLVARVDAYIREDVDHNGKSNANGDVYGWRKNTTRIAYMIHEHLQYSIERAMKEALGEVNSSVRNGLLEAVQAALAQITVKVDTQVHSR